jgi:predicted metal-dependent hydrolase
MKVNVRYGEDEVVCPVLVNSAISSRVRIHVYPNGDVRIEAPEGKSEAEIQKAAQKRARWIFDNRRIAFAARAQSLPREYVSGETHFYLGRRHQLVVRTEQVPKSTVRLTRGRLEIRVGEADRKAVKRHLDQWYKLKAREYFVRKLSELSGSLPWIKVPPPLRLISMKTQWGSCSPSGTINLNPALIKAPRHCIEYVMIHELCHLAEHNHSKKFYALLSRCIPNWQPVKAELDALAELLLNGQLE